MSISELENLEWDSLSEPLQDGLLKAFPRTKYSDVTTARFTSIDIVKKEKNGETKTLTLKGSRGIVAAPIGASYPTNTIGFYRHVLAFTAGIMNAKRFLDILEPRTEKSLFCLAAAKIIELAPKIRSRLHTLYFGLDSEAPAKITPVILYSFLRAGVYTREFYYVDVDDMVKITRLVVNACCKTQAYIYNYSCIVEEFVYKNPDCGWAELEKSLLWHCGSRFIIHNEKQSPLISTQEPVELLTFIPDQKIKEFLEESSPVFVGQQPALYTTPDFSPNKRVKLN